MEHVELLNVEERFQITNAGLVLVPDFSVPNGCWKNFSETVVVVRPDGQTLETLAQFNMSHFNIPDPSVQIDERWRVVVWLPNAKKEEVPIGSKVLVSRETRNAVLVGTVA